MHDTASYSRQLAPTIMSVLNSGNTVKFDMKRYNRERDNSNFHRMRAKTSHNQQTPEEI